MTGRWMLLGVALVAGVGCRGGNAQPEGLATLVDQCKADAAKRADVAVAEVRVVKAEAVVWSDGSLGCPKPGMEYIQMLIPGFRLTLAAGADEYDYHTDRAKRFVCCEGGGKDPARVVGAVETPETPAPSPAGPTGVLYLEPIPNEANLNSRLVLLAPDGGRQTVIEACTAFVVSPAGWILAKTRTSRSGHELLVARVGEAPRVVAKAFDFEALTFSRTDSRYAVLVRGMVGQDWGLQVGSLEGGEPKSLDWAPEVRRGNAARINLAGDLLLLTANESDDDPATVSLLDLQAQKIVTTLRSRAAALAPSGAE